jgi:ribosomal-protein-alanine N-acetyltransferase
MKPTEVFQDLPTLKTKRLILRKMTMADAPAVYAYGRDPEVTKYVAFPTHRSIEDAKSFLRDTLKRYRKGEPASWAIVRKQDARLIGAIGFINYSGKDARIEAGYALIRDCWGQGYMTEAFAEVIRFAVQRLGINRLEARCTPENIGSYRVMEKCGMRYEGLLRQHDKAHDKFQDRKLYAILREDWLKAKRR